MRELFIDIETFSPVNLAKSGVYPYADHDDFELLDLTPFFFGGHLTSSPVGLGRKVTYHHVQVLRTVQTRCCGSEVPQVLFRLSRWGNLGHFTSSIEN
ncbi:hypothetical protein CIP107505_02171 [Corynebacterium diphtheriae]|nr:hypothetical protein CIP107505_02171 [Corynebacterium diphtheriae]CAB0924087.1 hypothetical protein FRC0435_00053 [Corynebacterium diphtheriae]